MIKHETPRESDHTASLITVIMLRYAQEPLHAIGTEPPDLPGRLGDTAFRVFPAGDRMELGQLLPWLEEHSKPVLVSPLYDRGSIGVWAGDSMVGVVRDRLAHNIRNQCETLALQIQELGLSRDSHVRLWTPSDEVTFPSSHLQEWAKTYGVHVGWNVVRAPRSSEECDLEMQLICPGGRRSLAA